MARFPHQYRVGLTSQGRQARLNDGVKPTIMGGPPPEFGGEESWWSPEHLLLSSIGLCFMATLQSLASRSGLTVVSYASESSGILDRTPSGLEFVSFTLEVELHVPAGQKDAADRLVESAKNHCIVARSLKRPIDLQAWVLEVETPSPVHSP
jgi:organic hydroperoxide reductase OsmC/OhrA